MSESKKASRSVANIAGIVAIATLISKVFGLVREQIVAAAFGVGAVVNAYSYAYVIPGFLLILASILFLRVIKPECLLSRLF